MKNFNSDEFVENKRQKTQMYEKFTPESYSAYNANRIVERSTDGANSEEESIEAAALELTDMRDRIKELKEKGDRNRGSNRAGSRSMVE